MSCLAVAFAPVERRSPIKDLVEEKPPETFRAPLIEPTFHYRGKSNTLNPKRKSAFLPRRHAGAFFPSNYQLVYPGSEPVWYNAGAVKSLQEVDHENGPQRRS